jgi:hypothetical protein
MSVTGSANFSTASTNQNDENMLVIRGNTRVADIYLGEFMRMYNHLSFRSWAAGKTKEELNKISYLDTTGGWIMSRRLWWRRPLELSLRVSILSPEFFALSARVSPARAAAVHHLRVFTTYGWRTGVNASAFRPKPQGASRIVASFGSVMRSSNRSMTVDGFSSDKSLMPFTRRVQEVVIEGTAVERHRDEALDW